MSKRVSVAVVSNDIRGFDCDVIQGASWPPIFPQTTMTWTALRISIILRTGFTFVRTPGCLDDTRPTGWDSAPAARGSRPTGCSLSGQDFRSKSALMDKPRRMVRRSDYPHPRLVLGTTPRGWFLETVRFLLKRIPTLHRASLRNYQSSRLKSVWVVRVWEEWEVRLTLPCWVNYILIARAASRRFVTTDSRPTIMFRYYCIINYLTTI